MKKKMPLLVMLLILLIPMFYLTTVYGTNDIVDIFVNQVKIHINGENTNMPNLLYDNKTYVPLRDICDSLGISVSWDSKSNIAKLASGKSVLVTILYILSKSLELAGIILFAQAVFGRMKKDFYFLRKFNTSVTGMKRLIYTISTTRMGFYYTILGVIIGFWAPNPKPSLWTQVIILPLLVIIFWFLGMCAAHSISKREQSEILNDYSENS